MKKALLFSLTISIISFSNNVWSEDKPNPQPYIDHIKSQFEPENPEETQSYSEKIKEKLNIEAESKDSGSYTERLKMRDPSLQKVDETETSYTEKEKQRLGGKVNGGAIQAFKEGRSELIARKEGEIHSGFNLRMGVSVNRDSTLQNETRTFSQVYSGFTTDLSLLYEYQPYHSEKFGNFGIFAMGQATISSGTGQYSVVISKPGGAGDFGLTAATQFTFLSFPLTAGVDFRLNILHYIRPFILAGPSVIGFLETRNDNVKNKYDYSFGYTVAAGASFLLDWISGQSSWDLYQNYGIYHVYLTVDYSMLNTISGAVQVKASGVYAGLSFEF